MPESHNTPHRDDASVLSRPHRLATAGLKARVGVLACCAAFVGLGATAAVASTSKSNTTLATDAHVSGAADRGPGGGGGDDRGGDDNSGRRGGGSDDSSGRGRGDDDSGRGRGGDDPSGDDNGGRGELEPGDDNGGQGELEPGDDRGTS